MNFLRLLLFIGLLVAAEFTDFSGAQWTHNKTHIKDNNGHRKDEIERRMLKQGQSVPQCTLEDFSLGGQKPTFPEVKGVTISICQNDQFATFFDNSLGIPLYAVYMLTPAQVAKFKTFARPNDPWVQTHIPGITPLIQGSNNLFDQQLLPKKFHRGHVVPFETLSYSEESGLATFTYTNCVPQISRFNIGKWRVYEGKIRKYAKDQCASKGGTLYLITGTSQAGLQQVPDPNTGNLEIKPNFKIATEEFPNDPNYKGSVKIAIPNSMWTVGCCLDATGKVVLGAFAAMGNNVMEKDEILMSGQSVTFVEEIIQTALNDQKIKLFPAEIDALVGGHPESQTDWYPVASLCSQYPCDDRWEDFSQSVPDALREGWKKKGKPLFLHPSQAPLRA